MSDGTVRVRFLDADTDEIIGETDAPPERLPESFEARTTLDLGGQKWEVVRAEPVTRAEYLSTRALTVALRRIQVGYVSPHDLLYSLPTISDPLPGIAPGSTKLRKDVLEIREDDWRQLEFVSRELRPVIDEQCAHIRRILEARTGPGFTELHVRGQPTSPLIDRHITLDAIAAALPSARAYDGLAFENVAGLVESGFAFDAGDFRLYGTTDGGIVTACALQDVQSTGNRELARFADEHHLLLVDWCAAGVVDS